MSLRNKDLRVDLEVQYLRMNELDIILAASWDLLNSWVTFRLDGSHLGFGWGKALADNDLLATGAGVWRRRARDG